jgi:hypothetical protein
MTERTDEVKKRDYTCEIISFIVIVILSELSQFWYIVIAFCFVALCWGAIVMLGELAIFAASKVPWRLRASHTTGRKAGEIGSQVFQPSKNTPELGLLAPWRKATMDASRKRVALGD